MDHTQEEQMSITEYFVGCAHIWGLSTTFCFEWKFKTLCLHDRQVTVVSLKSVDVCASILKT